MPATARSVEEYRRVVDNIIELSHSQPAVEPRKNARLAVVLTALELETVDTASAALVLMDAGRHRSAEPLTRKALEFAVVGQWLHTVGGRGVSAFFDLHDIRDIQLGEQAKKAALEFPPELVPGRPPSTPEVDTLKAFEQVCNAFRGGEGLYFLYRALSGGCHPTGSALANWLEATDNSLGLRFSQREDSPDRAQMYVIAASLIWSGRAVDLNLRHRPRQRRLQAAAREIDIPSVLARATGAIRSSGPNRKAPST